MTAYYRTPELAYTAQVPGSRFFRSYGPDGVSLVAEPCPLPLFNAWVLRETFRQYGVLASGTSLVYALWMNATQSPLALRGILLGGLELLLMLAAGYLIIWWHWRSGRTIRVEGDQLLVRRANPLFTRLLRFHRGEIEDIVASYGQVIVRRKRGRSVNALGRGYAHDAGWMAAELRAQLGLE